ncbi:MAG: DMT family transporter [Caldilineaceae bacterium]|nr:DMT family transporter [Caldilineaceae bacterium]
MSKSTVSLFALLLLVDSLHFVFARALLPYMAPIASAMYVIGMGTAQVTVYALIRGRIDWRALRTYRLFFLSIGFFIAASTVLNYMAVAYIDAGTASMLGKMTTLWSMLLGLIWLREELTRKQAAGALVALLGVFIVSFQPGDYLRLGALMIVVATLLYALHAALVKRYGGEMDFLTFFLFRLLFSTFWLVIIAAAARALVWPEPRVWALLLLAGTVDVTISRALYYSALRRLPITLFAAILTLSPVIAVGWSFLLFGDFPRPQQLLGGLAVLVGVLLTTRK